MAIQTTVNNDLAFGIPGEIQDTTPPVIDTYIADSASGNIVGYAFTQTEEGKAVAGGAGVFVGILSNPKAYANFSADLEGNVEVRQGTIGEFLTKGRLLLNVGGAGAIGAGVYFVQATGVLGVGTAGAGQTQIAGAEIVKYVAGANGLALVQIW